LVGKHETSLAKLVKKKGEYKADLFLEEEKEGQSKKSRGKLILSLDTVTENNNKVILEVEASVQSKRKFGFLWKEIDNPYLLI
jgi:hypothetical protein